MQAEIVIRNAEILTMATPASRAEALAIGGGRILAVGPDSEVMALAGSETTIADAKGATVLPGFVESHMHLFVGAHSRTVLNLAQVTSTAALTTAIRRFSESSGEEGLLIGQGTQYAVLDGDRDPDRHALDAICPDRPLVLQSSDFHNAWCNTVALTAAGCLQGRDVGTGAEIEMGADGLATGVLKEFAALAPILALGVHGGRESLGLQGLEPDSVTSAQRAADKQLLMDGIAYCAAQGITTIVNMDGNRYQADLLKEIETGGDLACRVELPFHFVPGHGNAHIEIAETMRRDLDSDMLWSGRIKMFMDGVLDMGTAWRLNDYPGEPGERGNPLFDPPEFARLAVEFDRRGFQISVHAIGDAAVRATLDGYEAAYRTNGPRDSRHRIEHVELIAQPDRTRLGELDVVASLQPMHPPGCADFPLEPTLSVIDRSQWADAYLCRTLGDMGAPICFSSDWPVARLSPLFGIEAALTREPWTDGLSDERLDFEATLHAYTLGGAYAAHREKLFGSIEPGKAADIVMLDKRISPDEFTGAEVAMTICNGRITYDPQKRVAA